MHSPKRGWWCSRMDDDHVDFWHGPCALRPTWWNFPAKWKYRGMR